jgi:hypothetical protein
LIIKTNYEQVNHFKSRHFSNAGAFAQQTSTAAIKQTINTMMDAMRKGDSTLLRSVLAKDLELESVAGDKMGKVH